MPYIVYPYEPSPTVRRYLRELRALDRDDLRTLRRYGADAHSKWEKLYDRCRLRVIKESGWDAAAATLWVQVEIGHY